MDEIRRLFSELMDRAAPTLFVSLAAALWVTIGLFIANPDMFYNVDLSKIAVEFIAFHKEDGSSAIIGVSEAIALSILLAADVGIASVILKENRATASMAYGFRRTACIICLLLFMITAIFMPLSQIPFAETAAAGTIVATALIVVRAISYAAPKEFVELSS